MNNQTKSSIKNPCIKKDCKGNGRMINAYLMNICGLCRVMEQFVCGKCEEKYSRAGAITTPKVWKEAVTRKIKKQIAINQKNKKEEILI